MPTPSLLSDMDGDQGARKKNLVSGVGAMEKKLKRSFSFKMGEKSSQDGESGSDSSTPSKPSPETRRHPDNNPPSEIRNARRQSMFNEVKARNRKSMPGIEYLFSTANQTPTLSQNSFPYQRSDPVLNVHSDNPAPKQHHQTGKFATLSRSFNALFSKNKKSSSGAFLANQDSDHSLSSQSGALGLASTRKASASSTSLASTSSIATTGSQVTAMAMNINIGERKRRESKVKNSHERSQSEKSEKSEQHKSETNVFHPSSPLPPTPPIPATYIKNQSFVQNRDVRTSQEKIQGHSGGAGTASDHESTSSTVSPVSPNTVSEDSTNASKAAAANSKSNRRMSWGPEKIAVDTKKAGTLRKMLSKADSA
ncbi:hypothetical protein HK102_008601, partial [Quaeritorhiza haematococci]